MYKLVFMHLPKTGGTTIHNLLSNNFKESEVCGIRHNKLHLLHKSEIKAYTFFSGHYDFASIKKYITDPKQIITILREPKQRILSSYYFGKSHKKEFIDMYPEFSTVPNCYNIHGMNYKAAKEKGLFQYLLSEKEYLTDQMTKWICGNSIDSNSTILEKAKENLLEMKFIGLLEKMDLSINLLFSDLGFPLPETISKFLSFDKLHQEFAHCEKVEKEKITEDISELLEEITQTDQKLYQFAKEIFDKKVKKDQVFNK